MKMFSNEKTYNKLFDYIKEKHLKERTNSNNPTYDVKFAMNSKVGSILESDNLILDIYENMLDDQFAFIDKHNYVYICYYDTLIDSMANN